MGREASPVLFRAGLVARTRWLGPGASSWIAAGPAWSHRRKLPGECEPPGIAPADLYLVQHSGLPEFFAGVVSGARLMPPTIRCTYQGLAPEERREKKAATTATPCSRV